jgi:hypothetical protein
MCSHLVFNEDTPRPKGSRRHRSRAHEQCSPNGAHGLKRRPAEGRGAAEAEAGKKTGQKAILTRSPGLSRRFKRTACGMSWQVYYYPKEGFGFANNPHVGLTTPKWQEAAVNVTCPVTEINIQLIYK